MRKVLIIDAFQLAHRVWNVFQNPYGTNLTNSKGEPTGMQFGSLRVIHAVVKEIKPDLIHFAWDQAPLAKYAIDPEYKSDRQGKGQSFGTAITALREFWNNFEVIHSESKDQEADDVIATLVSKVYSNKGDQCFILSTDNDFLQLVKNGQVIVVKPPMGKQPTIFVDEEYVVKEWGVTPILLPHLRALIGDASDHLKGIPRFNKAKAAEMINQARSVTELYENLLLYKSKLSPTESQKLIAHKEKALTNLQLMRMQVDLPISSTEHHYNPVAVKASLERWEMNSYLSEAKLKELMTDFSKPLRVVVGEDPGNAAKVPGKSA